MGKYGYVGRTHKDFVRDLADKYPGARVLSEYKGYKEEIKLRCENGHTWFTRPRWVLSHRKGCAKCATDRNRKTLLKAGQERIDDKIRHAFHGGVWRVGPYISSTTPTEFKCVSGHTFKRTPKQITGSKTGCQRCGLRLTAKACRRPLEYFVSRNDSKTLVYETGYRMMTAPCTFRCRKCKRTSAIKPSQVSGGRECPHCSSFPHAPRRRVMKLGKREVMVCGFEDYAVRRIERTIHPDDIIVSCEGGVPIIPYKGTDRKIHNHYPDIFLPKSNTLIEVKSTWTIGIKPQRRESFKSLQRKSLTAQQLGYRYVVMLMNLRRRIPMPPNWERMTYATFIRWMKQNAPPKRPMSQVRVRPGVAVTPKHRLSA